ncbi:helix-turn-helix domain-containing protein [Petroclostridium sp. X23]|uniref:helix-turn-helix domain-containing protein n=1 Tax=Petroclostridium sp. X23 TaxID=3045146 RepID=UPI0024ACB556|nr:helix-turn-helix domain-containing protein [Petroclostridium sp. X23]WHH58217.1 helix-turn-helix domain-containing protein [Petroclostridium sp. X23]
MKQLYVNNYKYNSVFIKTFIVLILFSILPILAANYIIDQQSMSRIQRHICNTNINMLEKTSETVDLIFRQIEQEAQQLANHSNVVNYMINPDIRKTERNSKIVNILKSISYVNNYIHSIYIYSNYNDTILSSSGGAYKLKEFKDKEWLQEYKNIFLKPQEMRVRKVIDEYGKKKDCITLIINLPYASSSSLGAIVINVDKEALYNTINGSNIKDERQIFAINSSGRILLHRDESRINVRLNSYAHTKDILENDKGFFIEKVEGQKMLFTYVTSYEYGWKYIYTIPLEILHKDSKIVSGLIWIITLICTLLSLILSFIISKGMYHPLERLINLVSMTSKSMFDQRNSYIKNEYDFLGYAYNNVVNANRNMKKTIENMKPVMKEKLFTNLMMGITDNVPEIYDKIDFLEIDLGKSNYVVLVIQIDGYRAFCSRFNEKERNIYKIQLINIIEELISSLHKGICMEIGSDRVAAIINFADNITLVDAKEHSSTIAVKIKDAVEKYLPYTVTLGIGRMYRDIVNIKLSYNEAVNALMYKIYQGKNQIISIDDIDDVDALSEELYYYDSEKEKLLINNIKVGHQKEVDRLIEQLMQEILSNQTTSHTYIQQMFIRIISSIIELIINTGLTVEEVFGPGYNLYEEFLSKETIDEIKIWFTDICYTTISSVNHVNLSQSKKNAQKILEYMEQNLNTDISVNAIADWIGFSPAYVSRVFKENFGKNCTDYLNWSRIEKAKQLLKNTRLSVKEVGFRVGFNTIQSFMRIFKKYEGVTPGQYRDKM